jgi:hypothetical protein
MLMDLTAFRTLCLLPVHLAIVMIVMSFHLLALPPSHSSQVSGQDAQVDVGLYRLTTASGVVWIDSNANGIRDPDDTAY